MDPNSPVNLANNSSIGTTLNGHTPTDYEVEMTETVKDFYIDQKTENKYGNDVIGRYFRCRYADRRDFKQNLSDKDKMAIEEEEKRIVHTRANLCNELGDLPVIKVLNTYRREWRAHAKAQSEEVLRRIPQRFKDLKKRLKIRAPNRLITEEKLTERAEDERRILKKVKSWDLNINISTTYQTSSPQHPGANRHFDARVLTLNESSLEEEDQGKYFTFDGKMKTHAIKELLGKEGEEILKTRASGTIRYFHFPANNMNWIEWFMARYYGEDVGDYNDREDLVRNYDDRKSTSYRKGASNILRREFWQGQQHGTSADPIHARHMRSRVSVIPPDRGATKGAKMNFALFMPFLHWEMSKRRARMAVVVKECAKKEDTRKMDTEGYEPGRAHRRELADVIKMAEQIQRAASKIPPSKASPKRKEKEKQKPSPLGKYLLQIAKVADMMDCELDERLLRADLFKKSPLHPRRTLDQSYHWKLENTTARDRDQVVYRGTKGRFRSRQVVMVDSLWMWVLDEHTIVTAFPRRWGRNKPDPSGVHRGIRDRLEDMQEGDIRSVYDLASLVIDQCSRIFFDRTKPVDERPEVLDIFANSIANVSELSTNAFEEFWRHIEKLNHKTRRKSPDGDATASYFNINAEGLLLREAHDIGEELKMMQRVYDQQIHVTEKFKKVLTSVSNQMASKETSLHLDIHTTNPRGENFAEKSILETRTDTVKFLDRRNDVPKESIDKASDLIEELIARKMELEDLGTTAKDVSDQLNHLLSLKQQQASALEAKAALQRADESVTQGRTIMVFTIVTIVFLPLGFMSSIFGMNNTDFMNNPMALNVQFKYMFAISLGVILLSLALAFSKWWLLPTLLYRYSHRKQHRKRGLSQKEVKKLLEKKEKRKREEEAEAYSCGSGGVQSAVRSMGPKGGLLARGRKRAREACLV